MIIRRDFYINGAWTTPATSRDCHVIDPSTEDACAVITLGDQADTDAAVAAALAAFPSWAATPRAERRAAVVRILEQYERRFEDLSQAISMEMGSPIDHARGSQAPCLPWHLTNFLTAFDQMEWVRPLGPHAPDTMISQHPIGVVGLITPWNWPMNQIALKVIPAILAGCTRAGKAISKAAAETLKRVTLELGGKGANVIFADADDQAVERGVRHMMDNSGQSCNAPSRMLVQRPIYDRAVTIAAQVADSIKVGSAHQPGDHIGPVVNKRQWEQIQGYIQKGIDEGARLVAGGTGLPEGFNRGFYVKPTVFADVIPGMTIEREEIFGPVLAMIPFDTEADAARIANDSPYGLTHYVQTQDGAKRNRMALALQAGMVQTNGRSRGAGAFFGGVKSSGRAREGGVWGLEEFLESKAISGWDVTQPLDHA